MTKQTRREQIRKQNLNFEIINFLLYSFFQKQHLRRAWKNSEMNFKAALRNMDSTNVSVFLLFCLIPA